MRILKNKIIVGAAVLSVTLLYFSFDAKTSFFRCPFYALTGFECPGCGLQRSLLLLFRGNPGESIKMYWATLPILIMFAYALLVLKYRYKNGLRHLLYFFSGISVLIFCNYFFKIIYCN